MITPKDSCFATVQPRMGTSSGKLETWGAVRAGGGECLGCGTGRRMSGVLCREGNVWSAVQGGECLGCGAGRGHVWSAMQGENVFFRLVGLRVPLSTPYCLARCGTERA